MASNLGFKERGLKRVDFYGNAPGFIHPHCTSLYSMLHRLSLVPPFQFDPKQTLSRCYADVAATMPMTLRPNRLPELSRGRAIGQLKGDVDQGLITNGDYRKRDVASVTARR